MSWIVKRADVAAIDICLMLPQLMRKVIFSSDINDKLNDTLDFNLAYLMLFFTLEASSGSLRYIIAPFFLPPNDYKAIID